MTTPLWILVAVVGLQWLLIMAAATPRILSNGVVYSSGARDQAPEGAVPTWGQRMQRASDNLAENLPLFAILVLVSHVAGGDADQAELGAKVFLGGRLLHAPLYVGGVPWLRTGVWAVSIAGMGMIAASLF